MFRSVLLRRFVLLLIILGVLMPQTVYAKKESSKPQDEGSYKLIHSFRVGTGKKEIGIKSEGGGDPYGPSSFNLDEDGNFYVIDGINSRVFVLDGEGGIKNKIPLSSKIVFPHDISVVNKQLYILDSSSIPSTIYKIDPKGSVVSSWEVPRDYFENDQCITGISAKKDELGDIRIDLEVNFSLMVPFVKDEKIIKTTKKLKTIKRTIESEDGKTEVLEFEEKDSDNFPFTTQNSKNGIYTRKNWETDGEGKIDIYNNSSKLHTLVAKNVKTGTKLGSIRPLGNDAKGNVYICTDETESELSENYDAFVKKYNTDSGVSEAAKLPAEELFVYPGHGVRLDSNGNVFALIPKINKVDIIEINFEDDNSEEDEAEELEQAGKHPRFAALASRIFNQIASIATKGMAKTKVLFLPSRASAAWTKLNANDRAWEYINNSWYCSVEDYTRDCGDKIPRYITSYNKNWYSTPYCWGGFDLKSTFNSYMQNNTKNAGDIDTTGT